MSAETQDRKASLDVLLRTLKLPTIARQYEDWAGTAIREGWTFGQYLHNLAEAEVQERHRRRLDRFLDESELPREKTLATLDRTRLSPKVQRQLAVLQTGDFVRQGRNALAFGLPGRGKTHLFCAIGHELVRQGLRVYFTPAYALVQRLLAAKRDLRLEREVELLDRYDVVILDDIGYVQQTRDEMDVLFTFLAERYERRSVMITSNLVFSAWDRIFKDPMTTAAAIDRVVHNAVIVEMVGDTNRGPFTEDARRQSAEAANPRVPRGDPRFRLARRSPPAATLSASRSARAGTPDSECGYAALSARGLEDTAWGSVIVADGEMRLTLGTGSGQPGRRDLQDVVLVERVVVSSLGADVWREDYGGHVEAGYVEELGGVEVLASRDVPGRLRKLPGHCRR
jgi:DNA replication protein DnaC